MKETIYTIPINDAFNSDCKCAICSIETTLEASDIEYTLGASMMEPEFRINTNKKGFCKKHYSDLHKQSKALPLALVLQTHIDEQNKKLLKKLEMLKKNNEKSLFGKKGSRKNLALKTACELEDFFSTCAICDKVHETMKNFYKNIIYMWKTQPEFKTLFSKRCDFCLPHFSTLITYAQKELSYKDFSEFIVQITDAQQKSLPKLYDNVFEFVKSFDYRSEGIKSDDIKFSVIDAINKLSGNNLTSK